MIKSIITQFFSFTLICLPLISRNSTQPDFSSSSNQKITKSSRFRIQSVLANAFINVEFEYWQKQDQIIRDWLYSSLPPVIRSNLGRVAHESSHKLWNCLTSMHNTGAFSSVIQLKLQLHTMKKENASTCAEYLDQIQQIADRLRSLGDELSEQDLVLYTLLGLGQGFENFVSVHTSLKTLPHLTMAKLKSLLCASTTEKELLDSTAPTNSTLVLNDDSSFFPDTDTDQTHTSSISTDPIQITRCIHTTLNLENFKENYPRWEKEVFEVLDDCGLLGFLNGTPPSCVLANGFINAEFEYWQKQDQIVWDWLYSSLPPVIRSNPEMVANESSHQLWNCLTSMYNTNAFSSVIQLKLQLQTIKKDNASTCAEYLDQIQQIADRLQSLGDDLSEQDLVLYTLLGLGQEFETFVSVQTAQKTLPHLTMAKLKNLLWLSTIEKELLDSTLPTNLTSVLNDGFSFFPDTDTDQTRVENCAGHTSLNLDQIFDVSYQEVPSSSQQVLPLPLLSPIAAEDMRDFISDCPIPGIDQTHVENGAGLGAEDSDIARSLPQDTSRRPLQTWHPAAGD